MFLLDRILLNDNNSKEMDLKSAQETFGYFDKSYLIDIIYELLRGNEEKVLELYRNIYNQGIEPKLFLNKFLEIIYYLKNFKNLKNLNQSTEFTDFDQKRIENLSNEVDTKTLILFWEFSIEIINEINLVTNQHLSVEMFLIRLLYVKKKNTNSEINNNEFDNNSDNQNKKLVDDIRSSKSDLINKNKTIDLIKFSSQEKQKLIIEN